MHKRTLVAPGLAAATALLAAGLVPVPVQAVTPVYLAATLDGDSEVPAKGTKTGDRDGSALAVFRIHGQRVDYAVRWHKLTAPSGFHIHRGRPGENGPVTVPFFGQALPASLHAVKGTVRVKDTALLRRIVGNPGNWYANLHNAEFGGGAVRAQLRRIHPVELESILSYGFGKTLTARADGRQEVPAAGAKTGDRNGRADWLVQPEGGRMWFATAWKRIGAPVGAHVHRAPKGKNGPVAVPFLAAEKGLPRGVNGVAGSVPVADALARRIWKNPGNWYVNLHTKQFPGGAIRGQLYRGAW